MSTISGRHTSPVPAEPIRRSKSGGSGGPRTLSHTGTIRSSRSGSIIPSASTPGPRRFDAGTRDPRLTGHGRLRTRGRMECSRSTEHVYFGICDVPLSSGAGRSGGPPPSWGPALRLLGVPDLAGQRVRVSHLRAVATHHLPPSLRGPGATAVEACPCWRTPGGGLRGAVPRVVGGLRQYSPVWVDRRSALPSGGAEVIRRAMAIRKTFGTWATSPVRSFWWCRWPSLSSVPRRQTEPRTRPSGCSKATCWVRSCRLASNGSPPPGLTSFSAAAPRLSRRFVRRVAVHSRCCEFRVLASRKRGIVFLAGALTSHLLSPVTSGRLSPSAGTTLTCRCRIVVLAHLPFLEGLGPAAPRALHLPLRRGRGGLRA